MAEPVSVQWIPTYAGMTVRQVCGAYRHCGLDPPVHRDENDEEQSSSALQAHTLAQRDRRLVNPEVKGEATQQDKTTTNSPSPLMGEESKVRVKTMHRTVTSLRT